MQGRLFVSMPPARLTDEQEERLQAWLGEIPGLRAAASRHITLAFLGDCDEAEAGRALKALEHLAGTSGPVDMRFDRRIGLPDSRRARVAALAGNPPQALSSLALRMHDLFAMERVPHDKKPFFMHMTVGRMRVPTAIVTGGFPPVTLHAQEFHLMRSVLHPTGARHEVMAAFRL